MDFPSYEKDRAPDRATIDSITDTRDLRDWLDRAEDVIIEIRAHLEWLEDDSDRDLRARRVAAYVFWQIAEKNLKKRLKQINDERSRVSRLQKEPAE